MRLDRPTRTAVPGALYTSEFGTKCLTFQGTISGWLECELISKESDAPTYSLLLLLAGLLLLERIGGNKSTGKGQCQCTITSLRVGKRDYTEQQWSTWLNQLDTLSYYSLAQAPKEEA